MRWSVKPSGQLDTNGLCAITRGRRDSPMLLLRWDSAEPMNSPRVTVLMAAHNAADFIGQAVESVLAQTYEHFELLVVVDGSTDSTAELVRSCADPRVKL